MKRPTHTGRLRSHRPSSADPRPSARDRGYDAQWERLRATVLREEWCCRFCDRPAVIVDHILPISAGGAIHDRANCRPVCRHHHDLLTANYRATGINELSQANDPNQAPPAGQ